MLLCHCDRTLSSEEEDFVYIGGERMIVLLDSEVTFDQSGNQI